MVDRTPRATDTDGLLLGDLAPGARIGEYVVEAPRATRGTGHNYIATHTLLPRRVMVRVLPALDPMREASIIETLDHPGIPRVHECGILADRRPWIASELIEGPTVASQKLSLEDAAAMVRDVADILDHAHARGLVHHHVLPDTIVFARGRACLVDWSGARTLDSSAPMPMLVPKATRRYVPPERASGIVDGRGDVYALGMIAGELLERVAPDRRPPVFAALVARMVATEPDRRPPARHVRDQAAWLVDRQPDQIA